MEEIPLHIWAEVCTRLAPEGEMEAEKHIGLLDSGGVVAVIGGRRSNAEEYWDNPRCVFMQGDEAAARGLPANTRAVVFTRWCGHGAFKGILKQVRARNLTFFPIQGTGQLKRTLAALLSPAPATPPVVPVDGPALPVPQDFELVQTQGEVLNEVVADAPAEPEESMSKQVKRGEVLAWVRERYVPGLKFADLMREAEREKVPFKDGSISSAFYAIKRGAPPPKRARKVDYAVPVSAVPVAAPQPDGHEGELVRLIDDAIAGLHLVREAAVKVTADRSKMTEIIKLAQQLQS